MTYKHNWYTHTMGLGRRESRAGGIEPLAFPSPHERCRDSEAEAKLSPFRKKGEKVILFNVATKHDISEI